MARYTGPRCRLCRREGEKLFLKGSKCETRKCPFEKRAYPPGEHPYRRHKVTDYAKRLRETQKVKRFYGITESQFRRYFEMATRMRGNTGENLMITLERRLDNVVHLLRWAPSRTTARQLIAHGHILLNSRRHKASSYLVRVNDTISVVADEKIRNLIRSNIETATRDTPEWLQTDTESIKATVQRFPLISEVSVPANAGLIVEFCSR